ncbi:MAG: hypothetical protein EBX52_10575 [Proteobacteria bacterium]|nr:hypothetical protein [Pseudomonadota bacterium]
MTGFKTKKVGATIEADLYRGEMSLGHLTMDNVIFFSSVGCFGETYHVTKMLGLKDEDYRKEIDSLSLRNLSARARVKDHKIEGLIDQKLGEEVKEQRKEAKKAELEKEKQELETSAAPTKPSAPQPAKKSSKKSSKKSEGESDRPSDAAPDRDAGLQARKDHYAEEAIRQSEAQAQSDQVRVKATTDMISQIAGAAIERNVALGAAVIFPSEAAPLGIDSMTSALFGIVFGDSKRPEDETSEFNLTSGTEFMVAMNPDSLFGSDTKERATPLSEGTPFKQWRFLCEAKFFGNIKSWKTIQPYLGVGGATYREFDSLMKYESGFSPSASIGFAAVGHNSWFHMGYNVFLGALEIGFAL